MANTSDIRNGLCIEFSNGIYTIVGFQHVKPGKGNAFVRTKLKSLKDGRILEHTFPAGHKISVVRVEARKYQYLYKDDLGFHFMNNETYEQITIQPEMLDNPDMLKEGEEVEILVHAKEEYPLQVRLPQYTTLKITYTEPGLRGDTATNAMKNATVETGATVKVPLFINEGDIVKLDTKTAQYVERVSK